MNQQYYSMKEDNLENHHYMLVLFHAKENLKIYVRNSTFLCSLFTNNKNGNCYINPCWTTRSIIKIMNWINNTIVICWI